jgi:hypothetical protein
LWSVRRILAELPAGKASVYGVGMKGTTKVYRFRLYDIAADEFQLSACMATQACIRRIHGQFIRSTALEIDKRHLDADGMTAIMDFDSRPDHSPLARLVQ